MLLTYDEKNLIITPFNEFVVFSLEGEHILRRIPMGGIIMNMELYDNGLKILVLVNNGELHTVELGHCGIPELLTSQRLVPENGRVESMKIIC